MARKILNRFKNPFLSYSFLENIAPFRKLNKKSLKIIQNKKRFLGRTAKSAQNNIIKQSLLPLYLQQNKKNLVKNFDLDNLWLQNQQHHLLQLQLFPLVQTLQNPSQASLAKSIKSTSALTYNTSTTLAKPAWLNHVAFSTKKMLSIFKKQNKKLSFLFAVAELKLELSKKQAQFINPLYSDYKMRFLERKKLAFFYGNLTKKQLQKTRQQAKNTHSRTAEKFLTLLESRLDVILYRVSFCETISAARQLISRGKVIVNSTVIRRPGFLLKPGDNLSIIDTEFDKTKNKILERLDYLSVGTEVSAPLMKYTGDNQSGLVRDSQGTLARHNRHSQASLAKSRKHSFFHFTRTLKTLASYTDLNFKLYSQIYHDFFKERTRTKKNLISKTSTKRLTPVKRKESLLSQTFFINYKAYSEFHVDNLVYANIFKHLQMQRLLYKERSRKLIRQSCRLNPMKPLNIEVSYTLLTAIFLYSPQKLIFPGSIDLDLVFRELQS